MRPLFVALLALLASSSPAVAASPVICIDPGHERTADLSTERIGPGSSTYKVKDPGGTAGEATVVLQIGKKLRKILVRRGYEVVMTRTTMEFDRGNGGNIARAKFCNRHDAALMVRIHADGSTDRSAHGAKTLYPAWHKGWTDDIYARSLKAARLVQAAAVQATGAASLGLVKRTDLTGFNWANVPSILVECGFMSNPPERRLLQSSAYEWKVARGLTAGAAAFTPLR